MHEWIAFETRSGPTNSVPESDLCYGVVAALIMSLALGLIIRVWNWLTPVNEWEELKKGNIAVAIVLAAVVLGFAIVVSTAIAPGH